MLTRAALLEVVILIDTNAIIEAVRTTMWNALTGSAQVETVEECRDEASAGDAGTIGYVAVSKTDLERIQSVHAVTPIERASLIVDFPSSQSLDDGERDLFAHALKRLKAGDDKWLLCSPDKASIRTAVSMGWEDKMESLETLASLIGARPNPQLRPHFGSKWLSAQRTQFLLEP